MADAEADLHAEIEVARQEREIEEARVQDLWTEIERASHRKNLRDELQRERALANTARETQKKLADIREGVDADEATRVSGPSRISKAKFRSDFAGGETTDCRTGVAHGEHIWNISGMSWLRDTLWAPQAMGQLYPFIDTSSFVVGCSKFRVVYNPDAGALPGLHRGSLAIYCAGLPVKEEISVQCKIYIKARDGSFTQWGETVHGFCDPHAAWPETCFGPDVQWSLGCS